MTRCKTRTPQTECGFCTSSFMWHIKSGFVVYPVCSPSFRLSILSGRLVLVCLDADPWVTSAEQCCWGQLEHVERSFPTKSERVNKGFQEPNRSAPHSLSKMAPLPESLERCTRPCSRHRWAGWETGTMRLCIYLHGIFCQNPGHSG